MNNTSTIQRIIFPTSIENFGMYFKCKNLTSIALESTPYIRLLPNDSLSCDTYFNSFYQSYWSSYTNIDNIFWHLNFQGTAKIRLYRDDIGKNPILIEEKTIIDANRENSVSISIPKHNSGRVYIEIYALSNITFFGGRVVTLAKRKNIKLSAVITSYKREKFVHNNLRTLIEDNELKELTDIFVIDNGQTISKRYNTDRVHIIPNSNTGGAGGFSRGMIAALEKDEATHVLIMDDDISLHADIVLRTISFFAHCSENIAISGGMLDAEKPHILHEAGARWTWGEDVSDPSPLKLMPLKHATYLQSRLGLNGLMRDEQPDYGAFWFFAFSAEIPRRHGLCMPFFVVGDDIDFGLKATRRAKVRIVPLPGVAVQHIPFYFKIDSLAPYFFHRNLLVISAVHDNFSSYNIVKRVVIEVFKALCTFDYIQAYKIIRGIEDFIAGPKTLENFSLADICTECDRFSSTLPKRETVTPDNDTLPFGIEHTQGVLRDILRIIFIGGHLLPKQLLNHTPGKYITHRPLQWKNCFGHDEIFIHHKELHVTWRRKMDRRHGISLAIRCAQTSARLFLKWNNLSALWRNQAEEMSSIAAWRKRLVIHCTTSN